MQDEVVRTIGRLRIDKQGRGRDLEAALRDVRAALDAGQAPASMLRGDPLLARRTVSPLNPGAAPASLVSLRSSPLLDLDPLAPDWARGLRPAASRGPFLDELGERFWIDTFLLPRLVQVMVAGPSGPALLARLPLRSRRPGVRQLRLGAGSAWLPARLFVPGRPADELVGMRIRGGTLRLDGPVAEDAETLTLSGAWRVVLRLDTAPPDNPAPAEGPGADAIQARVELPASLTLTLGPGGLEQITFPDARATAYDTTAALTQADAPPFFDPLTRSVVLPGQASLRAFELATVRSELWRAQGSPPIQRSGWALPVTVTQPGAVGEAAGAGSVWLELGSGLTFGWQGLPVDVAAAKSVLSLAPGLLVTVVPVPAGAVSQRLRLWDEDETKRQASVEVESIAGSTVFSMSQPGTDAILFSGRAVAHLDRPLAADGGRLRVRQPAAWLGLLATAGGTDAYVVASDPEALRAPHLAFALENALLKVRPPALLLANGPLTGDQIESGRLSLQFPFRSLLPMLPDPYAANVSSRSLRDTDAGWAKAQILWATPATPGLEFQVDVSPGEQGAGRNRFPNSRLESGWVLVDVSSRADQLGVLVPEEGAGPLRVAGMSLMAAAGDLKILTLPPISWEPMLTKAPQSGGGDLPLTPPPHDGGPATVTADVVELHPVAPMPLLRTYRDAIQADQRFAARLPLPFGVIAHVERREPTPDSRVETFLNRPVFVEDGLRGGLQLVLHGGPGTAGKRDPTMPGFVELSEEGGYAERVLSQNVHTRFKGDFATSVPLRRYELSGYGASLFSDWRDPEAVGPAIIEARFDVLVGRTAHEVIQMQSILYPWFVRVVRSITMERRPGGWILREDSGWVATSDGLFAYQGDPAAVQPDFQAPAFPPGQIHPGASQGVVGVRHILMHGSQITLPAPSGKTIWQPVRFDADVLFQTGAGPRLAVAQGSNNSRTPSRGITGWILIDGPLYKTTGGNPPKTVDRVAPASAQQVQDLLTREGAAVAPLSCTLLLGGQVGEPGLELQTSRLEVSCTPGSTPHLVATVRGTPTLPREGAWSVARLQTATAGEDPPPQALDPTFPLPLVRPAAGTAGTDRWHFAEPQDILLLADASKPATVYGFVQSLGAQKVFFPRPRVGNSGGGAKALTLPSPPKLADMGALLHAAGIFPGLGQAFDIPGLQALDASAGQIGFKKVFPILTPGKALLYDLGGKDGIQLWIEYQDEGGKSTEVTVEVDPLAPAGAPRWSISLRRVGFAVFFKGSGLIRLFADVTADERSGPTVSALNVRYEAFLRTLQSLFSNIQQLARFLPGGAGAGLQVGFSRGRLTVRNAFALPNLPLGAGQITDVAIDMGFEVSLAPFDVSFEAGIGRSEKPFRWIVSPLAGTGVVRVGINRGGLDILVQAGIGVALAIDLGIAAGSASVTLALEINTGPTPFELRGIIAARASVDVLRGLASATLTVSVGLGIIPDPAMLAPPALPFPDKIGPFDVGLTASAAVGIHISICWVVDVDWEGYWQFRQDIHIPAIDIPLT